ncbi:hypothetical protein QTP88_020777 [Uroleucon formosanum]
MSPTRKIRQFQKLYFQDSLECSPPRKSLVKGERFFRNEREPELLLLRESWLRSARARCKLFGVLVNCCDGRPRKLVDTARPKRRTAHVTIDLANDYTRQRYLSTVFRNVGARTNVLDLRCRRFLDEPLLHRVKSHDERVRRSLFSDGGERVRTIDLVVLDIKSRVPHTAQSYVFPQLILYLNYVRYRTNLTVEQNIINSGIPIAKDRARHNFVFRHRRRRAFIYGSNNRVKQL